MTERAPIENREAWAGLYSLLAECLKQPDEQFVAQVADGTLESELRERLASLELDGAVGVDPTPPETEDAPGLNRQYLGVFEAFETPAAPPAESPYKEWYADYDGGLLGGPAAVEMQQRYDAMGVTPPEQYPADHVALLLEYASLLLEASHDEEFRAFVDEHLDWVPALRRATERAAAEAPFYEWVVGVLDAVLGAHRERIGLPDPSAQAIDEMVGRLGGE